MSSLLLKGGNVVSLDGIRQADVLCSDGTVSAIGTGLAAEGAPVEDVSGCYVLPGIIDPHVHFGWPDAADNFRAGSIAAACGGVTTVLEYAIQFPGEALAERVDTWKSMGEQTSAVDFGLHAIVSRADKETLDDVRAMPARGVTSFKMFLTSQHSGGLGIDDGALYAILRAVGDVGGIGMAHCENGALVESLGAELIEKGVVGPEGHPLSRPGFVEAEAVQRAVFLAQAAGALFYVPHLSSVEALDVVREARGKRWPVIAETCPQYLALTEDVYRGEHAERFVMSPPIKDKKSQLALWEGLSEGSLATIGSDHCPYHDERKTRYSQEDFRRIANGMPGVETSLMLLYELGVHQGRFSMVDLVRLMCWNPARIFGIDDRKGSIAVGKDADLVVFDAGRPLQLGPSQLHSSLEYSTFESMVVSGSPTLSVLRGQVVARDGEYVGEAVRGQYLHRHLPDPSDFLRI